MLERTRNGNTMNVLTFPVADGYEIEFISEDDGTPPQIVLSSLSEDGDDQATSRFVAELKHFSGKISLKRTLLQIDAPPNNNVCEQKQQEVTATDTTMDGEKNGEDFSEEDVSHSGRSENVASLPEDAPLPQQAKRSESPRLPPRIETASESKLVQTRSNSGSSASTVKSKPKVMNRMPSPTTQSPSFINSSKSFLPWDSQSPLKSLKKPTMQKSQSRGLSGTLLRKSLIPQSVRAHRNLWRGYFYRGNDDNWCNESGKIIPTEVVERLLSHLSSKHLSDKSPNTSSSLSEPEKAKMVAPPTKLHALCAAAHINYEDVEIELDERPGDTAVLDDRMRTPLHVLADNDVLFLDPQGRFTVIAVIARLIQIYPEAITIKDVSERMPFIALIEDWCVWVYDSEEEDRMRRRAGAPNFLSLSEEQGDEQQQGNLRRMSVNHVTRTAAQVTAGAKRTALAGAKNMIKFLDENFMRVDSMFNDSKDGVSKGSVPKAGRLYPQVKVSEIYIAALPTRAW